MQPKNYDFRKLLEPFEGKWVALSSDQKKVIASGGGLKAVAAKAKSKDAVFMKVLPFNLSGSNSPQLAAG